MTNAAQGDGQDEDGVRLLNVNLDARKGKMEIAAIMPNVVMLAAECTELLEAHDAKNYVQFDLMPRAESGERWYQVTVQRMDGKSPAQRVTEMERQVADLTTERDQLRQEVANLKRMLEDLTPGGSEFHNSPARCIEFIKGKLAMEGKLMRALAKERQRINRQEAEKRELLSIVNSLGLPIEDIEVETMSLAEYEERYGGHHR